MVDVPQSHVEISFVEEPEEGFFHRWHISYVNEIVESYKTIWEELRKGNPPPYSRSELICKTLEEPLAADYRKVYLNACTLGKTYLIDQATEQNEFFQKISFTPKITSIQDLFDLVKLNDLPHTQVSSSGIHQHVFVTDEERFMSLYKKIQVCEFF